MATLIASGALSNASVTEGTQKSNLENLRTMLSESFGLMPAVTATISAGAIAIPGNIGGYLRVDTQGGAGSDDLDRITGAEDGRMLLLRSVTGARVVTIRNNQGGAGEFDIGENFVLDSATKYLLVKNDGGTWRQVHREFSTDVGARRAYYMGIVRLHAYLNTTTGVSSGTYTRIPFASTHSSEGSGISLDTGTNRIFPPAGDFRATAGATIEVLNDGNIAILQIKKNGLPSSGSIMGQQVIRVGAANSPGLNVATGVWQFNGTTDYVDAYVFHDQGSSRNISAGAGTTFLSVERA